MGTNKFQEDYIDYLEECNANLQEKLVKIREFQTRLLNDRVQNRHCDTALKEVTNVCNSTCEAIDNLFENFTATMNSLKIVLLWKSQISQLPEKLSCVMRPENCNANEMSVSSSSVNRISSPVNEIPDNKNGKKCGTAKVSPMIDGHVISTPRIRLNRVSQDFGLQTSRSLRSTLSPIIETSPSTSPHNDQRPSFREARISLQRLELDNFRGKVSISKDSHKENTVPKLNILNGEDNGFKFRKPYDSLKARYQCRLMRRKVTETDNDVRDDLDGEIEERSGINEEPRNSNTEPEENSDHQGRNASEEIDPLEGPSWLLDKPQRSEPSQSSGLSSFRYNFINFKRPNYSSFSRSGNDDDTKKEILNFNENAQMGNFESNVNEEEIRTISIDLNKLTDEKKISDENVESLFEESSSMSNMEKECEGYSKSDNSDSSESKTDSLKCSLGNRNSLGRKSVRKSRSSLVGSERKTALRRSKGSFRLSYVDAAFNKSRNSQVPVVSKCSSGDVHRGSSESAKSCETNVAEKSKNQSPVPSIVRPSGTSGNGRTNSEDRKKSSDGISRVQNPIRLKRRAAELCYQRIHNLEIQSREGSLPKTKKRSKEKRKKSKVKY